MFILLFIIFYMTDVFASESILDHMKFLSKREEILSQNIANADTPHYKPKNISKNHNKQSFHIKRTHIAHMSVEDNSEDYNIIDGNISEIKPNGNGVTIENELMAMQETKNQYTIYANVYNKMHQMLKKAYAHD